MANTPVSDTAKQGDTVSPKAAAKPVKKPVKKTAAKAQTKVAAKPAASKAAKPKKAAAPKAEKNDKPKKSKLVRDSFTMPEAEYGLIAALKKRCVAKGVAVKKSEVLRAAIVGFAALSDAAVVAAVKAVPVIKTGRKPKGAK
jgi:hypothetical protein